MSLLVLMYQLRYIPKESLRIVSDVTLTKIYLNDISKLLKSFYCQVLKNFFIATRFLEKKKLSDLLKSYFFNSQLINLMLLITFFRLETLYFCVIAQKIGM